MKNDLEKIQRLLEQATATGDKPADKLDPETSPLREAWLAFGEILEAAQPPIFNVPLFPGEGPGVRAAPFSARPRWPRLLAGGLLAASLLVGVVTVWMLQGANRQENPSRVTEPTASTDPQVVPSTRVYAKTASTADEPQWDDALDEQFSQIGWQMTCVRHNQLYRTDAFGLVQYRMEQFHQAIQADSL